MRIVTIGGYGFDQATFLAALKQNRVDTFVDIRQRRGVRGHEYAFLNSRQLQESLAKAKIRYVYLPELAPTQEIRQIQKKSDNLTKTAQRKRAELSEEFKRAYSTQILKQFKVSAFRSAAGDDARVVALFCVETHPEACHRSLAAAWLSKKLEIAVEDIVP